MLLMDYGVLFRYLDNANTDQTPRALTGMLEWLHNKLGLDHRLLACPQSIYNYSIVDLLDYLKSSSRNFLTSTDHDAIFRSVSAIKLITFPRIERDNVLLHAIFGHEIGHPFADDYLDQEELGENQARFQEQLRIATEKVAEHFSDELHTGAGFPKLFDLRSKLISQVLEIRRRGLEELLSDAVAVQIFGPSAIFASREVFMTSGLDASPEPDQWYPPHRYRLRLMVDVAKKLGLWSAFKEAAPQIKDSIRNLEDVTEDKSDQDTLTENVLVQIAYEWIEEVLDDAVKFTLDLTNNAAYSPKSLQDEVPRLLNRLHLNIPPSEIGYSTEPLRVDWRSSILSAWIYRYRQLGNDDFDSMKLLHITRKAIEHVLLREDFSEVTGTTHDRAR